MAQNLQCVWAADGALYHGSHADRAEQAITTTDGSGAVAQGVHESQR